MGGIWGVIWSYQLIPSPNSMRHTVNSAEGTYECDLQVIHDTLLASLGHKSEFKRAFSVSACCLTK